MTRIVPAVLLVSVSVGVTALMGCAVQTSRETEGTSAEELSSGKGYLALGDSVAFGYNPVDAVNDPTNLAAFTGYPELIGDVGGLSPSPIASPACPGETSGSFITYGAPDNGCHDWRLAGYAMHSTYASTSQTQLQFALAYLAAHPTTATVSLGIGANDLLLVQNACEAAYSPTDPNYVTEVTDCELEKVPGVVQAAAGNIGYIATALRESGYKGQIDLVTYYAETYSATDPTYQSIVGLDTAMVEVAQGYPQLDLSIAKGFSAFQAIANLKNNAGSACTAGLLYKLSDGTCNIHPSKAGQALLAVAVAAAVPASSISLSASPPQF